MANTRKKPVIGITTWRRDLPNFTSEDDLYTLHFHYHRAVQEAGGIALLLPHSNLADLQQYLQFFDGLVITGGGDVDPVLYGEVNKGQSFGIRTIADEFERALIQEAGKRQIPTLGICRGHQIIQVAFGGNLLQDIYDTYPEHPKMGKEPPHSHLIHPVILEKDSALEAIYGKEEITVNSLHHQCVSSVGEGFKVIGWSSDGMIEACQSETDWFALGVQWHPELLGSQGQQIFDFFIHGITERKENQVLTVTTGS
ncbi:gamma-glutamyl-gamma-aminobutyrate hydrolase family protein [Neobacillus kokaensis]|uniref:Gamma-glutamyl-gamma-aminobutyrate hydrolase n=1 Tax=Neobacillus kokaensis TaxID=2759023 RepID=A0ABQ3N4E5_9BACI|nr:gamma-glutamyl-gamma-aminobutyrate hydrolase family protein [Neobacillus kokaensis]GHH99803.1 gamma-glutamyl-gamma-aminobutyrate hydrolase [Neobacillus kokaensis]